VRVLALSTKTPSPILRHLFLRASLFQEEHSPGPLDLIGDLAVQMGGHSGNPAGDDFTAFRDEAFEEIGIFVIDCLEGQVDAAPRHRLVGFAEIGTALRCFRLHGRLFDFAVQGVPFEERIVLFPGGQVCAGFFYCAW